MKTVTATSADDGRDLARRDRILSEARADRPLLDDRQIGRQRAGTQEDGEVVRALHREVAFDQARPAEDRRPDDGRGDVLVVEDDGEAAADIRLRQLAEDRARRAC